MKKINYLLIAAIASLTVASCQKEQAEQFTPAGQGAGQEFTVSLPEVTKTALVEGKTVWAKNDSLWVSNGTLTEKIGVPEESWGQKSFTFKTKGTMITPETPNMYMVYPYEAAVDVYEGKVRVKVPGVQDGQFKNANIAAAQTTTYSVSLKNVTAVLKVNIPDAVPVPIHAISINGNKLAGTCSIDFSGTEPAVTATGTGNSVAIMPEGLTGDFYAAVIPGTYDAGFSMTAATVDFDKACETKTTKSAKTVKINELVDLGSIGTNLQKLNGDGSETNPWQLENIGHMIAFAYAVNEGRTFEGEYLKVMNDISGISIPAGEFSTTYSTSAGYKLQGVPFQGDFDGNGKTLTLDINSNSVGRVNDLGLFGGLGDGAKVHNLVLAGRVASSRNYTGALAGYVYSDEKGVTISNVTNKANVSGNNNIGGLFGRCSANKDDLLVIENCKNEGNVTASSFGIGGIVGYAADAGVFKIIKGCSNSGDIKGQYSIGGLIGYAYYTNITDCTNSGTVTGTTDGGSVYGVFSNKFAWYPNSNDYARGVGGIAGWAQTLTVRNCSNSGEVTGITKVGGVLGSMYFVSAYDCSNSGKVSATGSINATLNNMSMAGGIVGWVYVAYRVQDCTNFGEISGKGCIGGLVGYLNHGSTSNTIALTVQNGINKGKVTGSSYGVGGICGMAMSVASNRNAVIKGCVNEHDITNTGAYTGGIVGNFYDMNNAKSGIIQDCVNNANVTGLYANGGIAGFTQGRTTGCALTVFNCENNGNVLATDTEDGLLSGGIVGYVNDLNKDATCGLFLYNCVNNGKVQYSEASLAKPYVGGIIGQLQYGKMENVANTGTVGTVSGTPAEGADAYLGGVAGTVDNTAKANYSYFKENTFAKAIGTASTATPGDYLLSFDTDGLLPIIVTIGEQDASTVDDALNLWVGDKTDYLKWTWKSGGPAFVKE